MEEPMRLAPSDPPGPLEHPFAAVVPRRSVDELFSGIQTTLILLTGQADLKANLVITTSSLVLTIVATRWSETELRPGLSAVAVGALLALFTAITVVIPKFRFHGKGEVRQKLEEHENPLFFGHFAALDRERFVEELAELASDDAVLYEAQARDLHDQGRYLVEKKYRHLRMAYIFLGLAFVAGGVAQGIASLV